MPEFPTGDAPFKLPDPEILGRSMASIAERSGRLVADWVERQSHAPATQGAPRADPLNIGSAFLEMTARMMANPARIVQAQLGFWQDYLTLWQNTTRRMMGIETTAPVIQASPKDKRFRDESWQQIEIFDFIKQSYLLSARYVQDVVQQVDGLDPKTARKVDFYTRQFVDAMSPSNFLLTNPEVLRKTAETGGENLLRGLNNLLGDLERGRGKWTVKMTDMDAFRVGENIGVSPGRVVFQERADATDPIHTLHPDSAEAPAADPAALDQQVLHSGPAAKKLLRPLCSQPGPHRLHGQLGQPRRTPG